MIIIYQHVGSPSNFNDTVPNPPNYCKGTFSHKYPKDQKQMLNKFTLFPPMGNFCANIKIIRSENKYNFYVLITPLPLLPYCKLVWCFKCYNRPWDMKTGSKSWEPFSHTVINKVHTSIVNPVQSAFVLKSPSKLKAPPRALRETALFPCQVPLNGVVTRLLLPSTHFLKVFSSDSQTTVSGKLLWRSMGSMF